MRGKCHPICARGATGKPKANEARTIARTSFDARVWAAVVGECAAALRSGCLDQSKLGQRGHAVVEAYLFDDLAVDHLQHRGAGEVHLAAGRSRKTADQEIIEGRT